MTDFLLNFKFKGDRNYVHGTDIYTKVLQHLSKEFTISNIDLSFHKVAKNNLAGELLPAGSVSSNKANPASIFKFNNTIETYIVRLFETNKEVTENYEYNEEEVIKGSVLNRDEKSILLRSSSSYTNIEKVVALNKRLLENLLTDPGKWFFTRISIDKDLNQLKPEVIALKLIKNIGSKITKTLILFDGKEQGYIYFSKV
jgi:hypothetical protein